MLALIPVLFPHITDQWQTLVLVALPYDPQCVHTWFAVASVLAKFIPYLYKQKGVHIWSRGYPEER